MDRRAGDNEYFHRDFHSSLNMGVQYLGEKYGEAVLADYLRTYTAHVYAHLHVEESGLDGIAALIEDTYKKEKASDALTLKKEENGITVRVSYCPGVKHLRETGREVSPYYRATTEVVMATLAEKAGAQFCMLSYDEQTGAAAYRFET
jgi:hypothetical protein